MKVPAMLPSKPRNLIARLAVLAGLFPVTGWIGGSYWLLDLLNHFQLQYAAFLGLAEVTLLCLKAWRQAALAAVFLAVPLVRIAPCVWPATERTAGAPLRFASFNVLTSNTRYADAVKWIRETDPDVIFLPEVDETWGAELRPLTSSHPHFIEHFVEGNFGFVFYSKLPILDQKIIPCGEQKLPLLKVRLKGPGGEFTLFGAHPVPPGNEYWANDRDAFLKIIAEQVKAEAGPVVLAGGI